MKKIFGVLCSIVIVLWSTVSLTKIGNFSDINIIAEAKEYGDFEYIVMDEMTVKISEYKGRDTEVTIPAEIDGKTVTSIGHDAFIGHANLTKITIPNSVTNIDDAAFMYCSSLMEITIPNSVTSIGYRAFDHCASLTEISIPNSVTSIGKNAFDNCTSLMEITIPDSVTSIGDSAFNLCTNLTKITISNSLKSINNHAFQNCTSLTNITIPDSVSNIGDSAFENCRSLAEIAIPDSVTSIGNRAFSSCTNLSKITISNSVKSINNHAFQNCTSLTNITIPDSVSNIGDSAFENCRSLAEIAIPDSVTSIGNRAFSSCTNLSKITIPNSVTNIGDSAFNFCTSLTDISIPNSVTSIGNYAFSNCTSLTKITIPNSVTIVGNSTFYECTNLTDITMPNSVTSISNYAFSNCRGLRMITIPNSVTSIGVGAFNDCTLLKEITIPNSVTSIEDGAFMYCSSLMEITIPNSVTSIGNRAFYSCERLSEITIPSSVTSIGNDIFFNVINGYKGSEAERYAKANGLVFKEINSEVPSESSYSLGDVNGDNVIDIVDAVSIINHINGVTPLTDEQFRRADVDGVDGVDISDAVIVIGYVVGERSIAEETKDKAPTAPIGTGYVDYTFIDIDGDNEKELIEVYDLGSNEVKYRIYNTPTSFYDIAPLAGGGMDNTYDYIIYDANVNRIYACTAYFTGMFNEDRSVTTGKYYQHDKKEYNYFINEKQVTESEYTKYYNNLTPLYSYKDKSFKNFNNRFLSNAGSEDKPKEKPPTAPVGSGYLDYTFQDVDNDGEKELIEIYTDSYDNSTYTFNPVYYRIYDTSTSFYTTMAGGSGNSSETYDAIVLNGNSGKVEIWRVYIHGNGELERIIRKYNGSGTEYTTLVAATNSVGSGGKYEGVKYWKNGTKYDGGTSISKSEFTSYLNNIQVLYSNKQTSGMFISRTINWNGEFGVY